MTSTRLSRAVASQPVIFRRIGDIAQVGTGSSDRKNANDGQYPFYVRSRDIQRIDSYEFDEEAIIIPGEGGIGDIFHFANGKYALHQRAYRIKFQTTDVDTKYAYYYFNSHFKEFILRKAVSATVMSIRKPMISDFRIAVPDLEVQREIVGILDTFAELEAELEAELDARRRQYDHYRRALLSPPASDDGWDVHSLAEIADVLVGFPFESAKFAVGETDATLIRGDNIGQGFLKRADPKRWHRVPADSLDRYELHPGDIVLAMDRPWIPAGLKWARISTGDLPALLVQRVARLRALPYVLDQRFLGYVISSARFTEHVLASQTGNTVPHISGSTITSYRLSVPPLDEQRRIAKLLDQFEALANSLTLGLPAELAARRRQYEHYRDRLLTFEELQP